MICTAISYCETCLFLQCDHGCLRKSQNAYSLYSDDMTVYSGDRTVYSDDMTVYSDDMTVYSDDMTVYSDDMTVVFANRKVDNCQNLINVLR